MTLTPGGGGGGGGWGDGELSTLTFLFLFVYCFVFVNYFSKISLQLCSTGYFIAVLTLYQTLESIPRFSRPDDLGNVS